MEEHRNSGGGGGGESQRSSLHSTFTHTANALASLYKQSLVAERDARESGARTAYHSVMQWAARVARTGRQVSVADVISMCASELGKMPQPNNPTTTVATSTTQPQQQAQQGNANSNNNHNHNSSKTVNNNSCSDRTVQRTANNNSKSSAPQQQQQRGCDMSLDSPSASGTCTTVTTTQALATATNMAYIARDEGLVSDIKKLNVNPRKRQRVEISEAFVRACRSVDNAAFLLNDLPSFHHRKESSLFQPSANNLNERTKNSKGHHHQHDKIRKK